MAIIFFCLFVLSAFTLPPSREDVCQSKLLRPLAISPSAAALIQKRLKFISPGDFIFFKSRRGSGNPLMGKYLSSDRDCMEVAGKSANFRLDWSEIAPFSIQIIKNFPFDLKTKAIAVFSDTARSQIAFVARDKRDPNRLVGHHGFITSLLPSFEKKWHAWIESEGGNYAVRTERIVLQSLLALRTDHTNNPSLLREDILRASAQKKLMLIVLPNNTDFTVEVIRPLADVSNFVIFQKQDHSTGTYTFEELAHAQYLILENL